SFIRDAFVGQLKGPGITIKDQYAGGDVAKLPSLAEELVRIPVDVIVASGTPAAQAAKNATRRIPIVFATVGNPELVKGPNVTGVRLAEPQSSGRRLRILKDAIPSVETVAVLVNLANPAHADYLARMELVANELGIKLEPIKMPAFELEGALNTLAEKRPNALVVLPDPSFHKGRSQIISFADANEVPTMYSQSSYVEQGGLMSYGPNYPAMFQQAADLVISIL